VVSDVATLNGLPTSGPVRADLEPGSSTAHRLLITPTAPAGTLHYALIINTATATPAQLAAAKTELTSWLTQRFPTG
jgi:hypothetical protein